MAQKLILPMNNMRTTCTYKHPDYQINGKKMIHYAIDCSDRDRRDFTLWGSGKGIVKAAGYDNIMGNVVVVVYKDCMLHDGTVRDLTFRYCHLRSIAVKKGQSVTKDTRIGIAGHTGAYAGNAIHLHLEVDGDTNDRYVCWTPTLSGNSNIFKKGTDSTIDPLTCLWVKTTHPDYQTYMADPNGWITEKSKYLPKI